MKSFETYLAEGYNKDIKRWEDESISLYEWKRDYADFEAYAQDYASLCVEEEKDIMRQLLSEMSASTIRFGGDKMSDSYMSRMITIAEIEDALKGKVLVPIVGTLDTETMEIKQKTDKPQ